MQNALVLGAAPNVLRDFVPVVFVHLQSLEKMKIIVHTLTALGKKKTTLLYAKRFSLLVVLAMEQ